MINVEIRWAANTREWPKLFSLGLLPLWSYVSADSRKVPTALCAALDSVHYICDQSEYSFSLVELQCSPSHSSAFDYAITYSSRFAIQYCTKKPHAHLADTTQHFFFALLRKLFSKTSTIFPYYNPGQEALDSITSLRVQNVIRACRTHSNLCLTGCVGWSVCFLLGQSPAHLAFTAILNTDQFFATSQRLSRWHFNLLVNLQANAALHYDMHLSFLILLLLKPSFCSGSKS